MIHLTDSLLKQVISGSSWVKNTFLELFDQCDLNYLQYFLGISLSTDDRDMKFIGDVCLKGVMKFNNLSNTGIIQMLGIVPALLELTPYNIIPDYCFELLILCYKRSLDHTSIKNLADKVNLKLSRFTKNECE